MVATFETGRLRATRIAPEDIDDLARMHTDPAVMAGLGGKAWTLEETRAFLGRVMDHWDRYGYGLWTLRRREDDAFVGRAGLRRRQIDGYEETELMFACMPAFQARGLATEAVQEIARLACGRLMMPSLIGFVRPDDAASRRVVEKSGFAYERDAVHAGGLHALYRRKCPA